MSGGKLSRAAGWMLLGGIRFYQAVWSPLMPGACKFHPSCSSYAAEAIAVHGPRRGVVLALGRLWRCRPFTRGGIDPVPAAEPQAHTHPSRVERPFPPNSNALGAPTGASTRSVCEHQP